jgi:LacI family transcriptional regulator
VATIRTVADLAGVSTATVSHVINDTRAVSAPLTARVLEAMEQLHYHPDVVARSLRRRETLTLGLLVPSIEIPFFAVVARDVEAAANDAGYSVILCNSGWSLDRELQYLNNLLARRVDGLLCISLEMTAEHIAPLLRRNTPVVLFDEGTMRGIELDAVEIDNFQGAYDATAHLLALGHRRVGCNTGLGK